MKIRQIAIEEAVGKPLAHDLTKIDAKNRKKGARFKKEQIVTEEDLPVLRDMSKGSIRQLKIERNWMAMYSEYIL